MPPPANGAAANAGAFKRIASLEPFAGLHVERYVHPKSGLQILIAPRPGSGAVAYVTAYNVGSRFEVQGRTGLAHLFEHMMFRGTESYPEPFKTLSSWGDRFNAFTEEDLTLYHELVPKAVLGDVAKFEAERMRKLQITPDGFKTERGAVISERKMRTEDASFGRLNWELNQLAFDTHPYKTGPIGWQEDLDATSFDDAIRFYQRFYAPNRAVLVMAGDITVDEALNLIAKYYGDFEAQPWTDPVVPAEKPRKDFRRKVIPMKAESVYIADAIPGFTFKDPDVAVDSLLCTLMADGDKGYYAFELVEKGLARQVSSSCFASVDPGLSSVFVIGNPGVPLPKLEKAYDQARKGFLKWVREANRIEKAKLYYLAEHFKELRDPMNLAEQLGSLTVASGDPLYNFSFMERLKKVTAQDIERRFKAWEKGERVRVMLQPSETTAPMKRKS